MFTPAHTHKRVHARAKNVLVFGKALCDFLVFSYQSLVCLTVRPAGLPGLASRPPQGQGEEVGFPPWPACRGSPPTEPAAFVVPTLLPTSGKSPLLEAPCLGQVPFTLLTKSQPQSPFAVDSDLVTGSWLRARPPEGHCCADRSLPPRSLPTSPRRQGTDRCGLKSWGGEAGKQRPRWALPLKPLSVTRAARWPIVRSRSVPSPFETHFWAVRATD